MNTNITARLCQQVSENARRLYDVMPDECWLTSENLAKSIGVRKSSIRFLKDELEGNGLIEIRYGLNGKRQNLRETVIKVGNPIKNKHIPYAFSRLYAFSEWQSLERNSLVECYLKSKLKILPFEPKAKRPLKNLVLEDWNRKNREDKMDVFFNNPSFNIGLILPNVTVVDIEIKNHFWSNHSNFQNTLTVETPRGFHHYFINDFIEPGAKILPDIDVRGKDSLIVLPGSKNADGKQYQWHSLQKPRKLPIEFRHEWRKGYFESYSRAGRFIMPSTIPLGTRNDTLWRYGRSLHWHGQNYFEIETALIDANRRCDPPFAHHELRKLIEHIYTHPNRS